MFFYSFCWGSIFYGDPQKDKKDILDCKNHAILDETLCLFFLLSGHGILEESDISYSTGISSGHYTTFYSYRNTIRYNQISDSKILKIQINIFLIQKIFSLDINNQFHTKEIKQIDNIIYPFIYNAIQQSKSKLHIASTIINILFVTYKRIRQKEYTYSNKFDSLQIEYIKKHLKENMETPPSFKQLCRMSGMSSAKFCHSFKQQTGVTPYMYLRKIRLQKAMRLLQETDLSITDISYDLGYKNISYFSKIFFDFFGILPSDIRNSKNDHIAP